MQVLALLYLLTGFTYLLAVKGTYPWVFLNYYPKPGEQPLEGAVRAQRSLLLV